MKQLLALLLALTLAASLLTGCGGEAPAPENEFASFEEEHTGDLPEFEVTEDVEDAAPPVRRGLPVAFTPAAAFDGSPLTEDFYLYRSTLTREQQAAYDILRAGLLEGKASIDMTVPLLKDDLRPIVNAIYNDCPEIVWFNAGYGYTRNDENQVLRVRPHYIESYMNMGIDAVTAAIEEAVRPALEEACRLERPIDREKYLHDYVAHVIDYTNNAPFDQTVYGGLVEGKCVCGGYSRCFQYLMQRAGVPCTYARNLSHAWNLVELDGEYYEIDVTFDDTGEPPRYTYFNQPHEEFTAHQHHRIDSFSEMLPTATGTKYYYNNIFTPADAGTDFSRLGQSGKPEPEEPAGGWWNELDDSWTRDSWETVRSGLYRIDDGSNVYYYDEADGTCYSVDPDGTAWILNRDSGEWTECSWSPDGTENAGEKEPAGETAGPDGSGWWNELDETWSRESWVRTEDGSLWVRFDEESGYYYYWNEEAEEFTCEEDDGSCYRLDSETGEWVDA